MLYILEKLHIPSVSVVLKKEYSNSILFFVSISTYCHIKLIHVQHIANDYIM